MRPMRVFYGIFPGNKTAIQRVSRNGTSDFDEFCEERNRAIEIVLREVRRCVI